MTIPIEYKTASKKFDDFMLRARDFADLPTTNMAWNMVVGVLHTFRRRLTIQEALSFADALPPAIRALFLEKWDTTNQSDDKFGNPEELLREVRSVRSKHNFSPDKAIQAVASAMREIVDIEAFERALSKLSPEAQEYWRTTPQNRSEADRTKPK